MPKPAKWSPGKPAVSVGTDGTLTASVPINDAGTLAATLTFTLTADRALTVLCDNQPGAAGLTGFAAWSREG
jgi:hypothetical protein